MVESFTPAGCGSRRRRRLALALFTGGAVAAAAALGALLGALGSLLPDGRTALLLVAGLALLAALREAGLVRLPLPQLRRQVPDRWRAELPLPAWSSLYGAGLGAGVFTYQPVATFWVACAGAVALGRPLVAAGCFALYGVGRAAMVVLPSRGDAAGGAERLARHALSVRRLNAAALTGLAALLLLVPAGGAEATTLQLGAGRQLDPSVSNGILAYTQRTGTARSVVVRPSDPVVFEDAESPALDGARVAYADAEGIRVVDWTTGEELARAPGQLRAPALQWPFLAFLVEDARGKRIVLSNLETGEFAPVASVGRLGMLGRPVIAAGRIAWHAGDARSSRIVVMELESRQRRVVASTRIGALTHPALSATHVAWVDSRSGRSRLMLRPLDGAAPVRTLVDVRARGTALWTTALWGRSAWVARWQQPTGRVQLQRVGF